MWLMFTFYRSFLFASLLMTAICITVFWKNGIESFMAIFWFKIAATCLLYYFVNTYKAKEFYYYQNLGISKQKLWTVSLGFDFLIFIISLIVIHKMK